MKVGRITNDGALMLKGEIVEATSSVSIIEGFIPNKWSGGYSTNPETPNIYYVAGKSAGFSFPKALFEDMETYILSFKIKKTSGDILSIGGHSAVFQDMEVYLDNTLIGNNWSAYLQNTYPNDNLEHSYKVVLTFRNITGDGNLYFQPNRNNGYATDYTAEVYDLKLEKIVMNIPDFSLSNQGDLQLDGELVELEDYYLNIPTSGRINIPYNPTLAVSNTFSMSMWVNFTARSGWKSLFTQGSWSQSWTFWQTSGIICLTLNGTHYRAGIATIQTNTWNHIAVTYNDGIAKYYQDGVLIDTLNVQTGFSSGTQALTFNDSSYPINGSVKDIRIIDRVITDSEVQNIYNNSDYVTGNEILWLPLNDGIGDIANDISGNGNNGTITNGTWGSEPVNIKLKDGVLYVSELIENAIL